MSWLWKFKRHTLFLACVTIGKAGGTQEKVASCNTLHRVLFTTGGAGLQQKAEGQLLTNANELLDGFLYFAAAAHKLAEASKLTQNNASDTCLL